MAEASQLIDIRRTGSHDPKVQRFMASKQFFQWFSQMNERSDVLPGANPADHDALRVSSN